MRGTAEGRAKSLLVGLWGGVAGPGRRVRAAPHCSLAAGPAACTPSTSARPLLSGTAEPQEVRPSVHSQGQIRPAGIEERGDRARRGLRGDLDGSERGETPLGRGAVEAPQG